MSELDSFGKAMIENAYDRTIESYRKDIFCENAKGILAQHINKLFKDFSQEQLNAICELIPAIVESTLFEVLEMCEQEDFSIIVDSNDNKISLADESDGLSGELFGNSGWIAKYSALRSKDTISMLMDNR